jgi:hypothetical protein
VNAYLAQQLHERNNRIIKVVIRKSEEVCPGSVALIGISGSFYTGDFYEKSDLDLCIVINNDAGWKVHNCFIQGEVAHDIYCTPWEKLEEMAQYNNPYVIKLLNLDIIYCANDKYIQKYMDLRKQLECKLNTPLSIEDIKKAEIHLNEALISYAEVLLRDSVSECKYASAKMLRCIEYTVYMLNKTYVKRGIKRIPEEIREMKYLPNDFFEGYINVVEVDSVEAIKSSSTMLMKMIKEYVKEVKNKFEIKKEITSSAIVGTYEEVYSNWRNKMYYAAETGDIYLSLMTDASCQNFYDGMYADYNIDRINVIDSFDPNNLKKTAESFDIAMEKYKELYISLGEPVKYYSTINDFEKDYLKKTAL